MLPLLAEASESFFDSDNAKVLLGIVAVGLFVVMCWGISMLRDLRKNLTSEVRMQLRDDEETTQAARIPNPISVKAHIDFTPYHEHKELKSEFEKLREQRRSDVHGLHLKIEQGLKETRDDIANTATRVAQLQISNERQNDQLVQIRVEQQSVGARIDSMPSRIIQNLKDTKGLLS